MTKQYIILKFFIVLNGIPGHILSLFNHTHIVSYQFNRETLIQCGLTILYCIVYLNRACKQAGFQFYRSVGVDRKAQQSLAYGARSVNHVPESHSFTGFLMQDCPQSACEPAWLRMAPDDTGGSYGAQWSVTSLIWKSVRLLHSRASSSSADVRHPPQRATILIPLWGAQHYISGNQQQSWRPLPKVFVVVVSLFLHIHLLEALL